MNTAIKIERRIIEEVRHQGGYQTKEEYSDWAFTIDGKLLLSGVSDWPCDISEILAIIASELANGEFPSYSKRRVAAFKARVTRLAKP